MTPEFLGALQECKSLSVEQGDLHNIGRAEQVLAYSPIESLTVANPRGDKMNRVLWKALARVVVEAGARVDRLMEMFQFLPVNDNLISEAPTRLGWSGL